MNLELMRIAAASEATVVFVTHSISEAVFLADRVVLLVGAAGAAALGHARGVRAPRSLDMQTDPAFAEVVRDLRHQLDEDEEEDRS